jgi:hypothetical protein
MTSVYASPAAVAAATVVFCSAIMADVCYAAVRRRETWRELPVSIVLQRCGNVGPGVPSRQPGGLDRLMEQR